MAETPVAQEIEEEAAPLPPEPAPPATVGATEEDVGAPELDGYEEEFGDEFGVTDEDPPAPPWAGVTDPDGLLDVPEVQQHLERRERRIAQDLRAEYDRQYADKLATATRNWEATKAANTLAGYVGNILQKVADADAGGMDRSTQRLIEFAQPLMNDYRQAVMLSGVQAQALATNQVMLASLDTRQRAELEDYLGEREATPFADALERWGELKYGRKIEDLKRELLRKDDVIGKIKAMRRNGAGPSLASGSPGGTRPYSKLTPEERQAMSSDEIDVAVAQEMGWR